MRHSKHTCQLPNSPHSQIPTAWVFEYDTLRGQIVSKNSNLILMRKKSDRLKVQGVFQKPPILRRAFSQAAPQASAHPKKYSKWNFGFSRISKSDHSEKFYEGLRKQTGCGFENFHSLPDSRISIFWYGQFITLLEIQKAADALSIEEKRHLMIFLLRRLRNNQVELPPVRDIPKETIEKWIEDDESGYKNFLDSKSSESSEK